MNFRTKKSVFRTISDKYCGQNTCKIPYGLPLFLQLYLNLAAAIKETELYVPISNEIYTKIIGN